jgi:cardiolipin synthase
MTVPNLITTIRIILTPIFIIYLLDGEILSALVVFAVCGISDGLDGFLARVLKQKSKLGAYLDPIADKLILASTFVVLAVMNFIPTWLAVTVISRDVLISLGVIFLMIYGMEIRIRPSIISKITTCLQFITVIGVLSSGAGYLAVSEDLFTILYQVTGVFTISSGLHYIHSWFRMMGEGSEET